ncbi:MAG: hypothetical protein LBC17_03115, partial [Lactobacillaceae bacterium]|nr:hypothetical protein [Lactobacillaceae bacterium]
SKSGLGSSASISVAIVRAFYDFFDLKLTNSNLIELANYSEMINHTNASGVDVQTIVNNAPILFSKEDGITKLRIRTKGYILLLDSNTTGKTSESVLKIKQEMEENPEKITKIFQDITENEKKALNASPNNFGQYLTNNHLFLKELKVSTAVLDNIIDKLISLGADGAKLTGGGLGGSVIAYFKDKQNALHVKNILNNQYSIWISEL